MMEGVKHLLVTVDMVMEDGKTHKKTFEMDPSTSNMVQQQDSRYVFADLRPGHWDKPTHVEITSPARLSITGDIVEKDILPRRLRLDQVGAAGSVSPK